MKISGKVTFVGFKDIETAQGPSKVISIKVGIDDRFFSSFVPKNQDAAGAYLAIMKGQEIEVEVFESKDKEGNIRQDKNGKPYWNFKLPGRVDLLEDRVRDLEDWRKSVSTKRP